MQILSHEKGRKIVTSTLVILSILMPSSSGIFASGSVDFNVKMATAGDETYATSLSNLSNRNSDITFQFVEVSNSGVGTYSINLPTGFVYRSHNTTDTNCANFSVLNASNGNYNFSFNGIPWCLAKTEFTYWVTSTSLFGNNDIFLLEKNGSNWSMLANITLGITSANSITKARTVDLNANGYADAYILSLASNAGMTVNDFSGITVGWTPISTTTLSGSHWIVSFADNILGTGEMPQLGGVFDGINLTNNLINEEDGASPRIMTISGNSTSGANITIGTGTLVMEASERLSPGSAGSFSLRLGAGTIAGTMTLGSNMSILTFVPTSPLLAGTYTLVNTTGATDWSAGVNVLSQNFPNLLVPDTTPPSSGSIIINSGAVSTTSQIVSLGLGTTDNIGVTSMMISNSPTFSWAIWEAYVTTKAGWSLDSSTLGTHTVYVRFRDLALNVSADYSDNITLAAVPVVVVPPSTGWGWGGWGWGGGGGGGPSPDSCPTGDKSGNFYDNICNAPITNTGTTSTGSTATGTIITPVAPWIPSWSASPSDISGGTMYEKYFSSLSEAREYLLGRISHRAIVKLINSYGDKLAIPDESYFLSVDQNLYGEYNRIINAYALLFLRVQDAVSGNKSDAVKADGRISAGIVTSGLALAKNFLDRYVIREYMSEQNITVYRTKNPLLTKPLSVLEKKILTKFDSLLVSGKISRSEYDTSVQAYDDFILHLMIYRDYGKNTLSKERAIAAMKIFLATYKK